MVELATGVLDSLVLLGVELGTVEPESVEVVWGCWIQ